MAEIKIMAHIVAGYPDEEGAFAAGLALKEGGASLIEVQFPFSDPSADGPAIQTACSRSLAGGFRLDSGFAFVKKLVEATGLPVFIMGYASCAFARGIERFCADAADAGATGLIIPDLVPGADEGLASACAARGLSCVPVIAPSIKPGRLAEILATRPRYLYAALRAGITGTDTRIDESTISFVGAAAKGGAEVMAGFGISTREQILALAGHVAIAIVGSHFTRTISAAAPGGAVAISTAVKAEMEKLAGR